MVAISLLLMAYGAWCVLEYHWFKGRLPARIGVTYPLSISGHSGMREGCGAAIFRMSDATAASVSREGIRFLAGATQARAVSSPYGTYRPWQETPVPADWTSDGTWSGLDCSSANRWLLRKILDAAGEKGSYYTTKPEGSILIIPAHKLVVFSYFG
ncbi:hypothetical protein FNU76_05900 [Chitinimonas arctica]|uniref:Uncharacterized protein n=1 Tax=Chitinimonas arctica TaxID=2594795 RepID=A0A516SCP4_9NEIS|nr:hypothetical protein [Chitinimonas arctica]QDQ25923.1 hypothetical protein FNU76_05900 [Chitinimonas arctica]